MSMSYDEGKFLERIEQKLDLVLRALYPEQFAQQEQAQKRTDVQSEYEQEMPVEESRRVVKKSVVPQESFVEENEEIELSVEEELRQEKARIDKESIEMHEEIKKMAPVPKPVVLPAKKGMAERLRESLVKKRL